MLGIYPAISGISFNIPRFQNTAILGATGSGKTTLLKLMAGLEMPDAGAVYYNGKRVLGSEEKLIPGHEKIGYLSQHFELRNNYRVSEILSMAQKVSDAELTVIIQSCDIFSLLERWTDELSGGERQRVSMAAMLAGGYEMLLLDEPYSNLDPIHKKEMRETIARVVASRQATCLMVSHDTRESLEWADQIIILEKGKIIQSGSPEEIYFRPANFYCACLTGDYQLLPVDNPYVEFMKHSEQNPGKKLFVRPAFFRLESETGTGIKAQVNKVSFAGDFTNYELTRDNCTLQVLSADHSFKKGDSVMVSCLIESRWYL